MQCVVTFVSTLIFIPNTLNLLRKNISGGPQPSSEFWFDTDNVIVTLSMSLSSSALYL
jgi:hypothetical protein